MHCQPPTAPARRHSHSGRNRARGGLVAAAVTGVLALAVTGAVPLVRPVTVAHALNCVVGAVTIDDFNGKHLGVRTFTPLPLPGTSTNSTVGTFNENGDGTATMTMDANGNAAGGVILDYTPAAAVDLAGCPLDQGGNGQFFIDFHKIALLPELAPGENAVSLTMQVWNGNPSGSPAGTLNTGIANTFAFSPALPFSKFSGGDFSAVTKVEIQLRFPYTCNNCNKGQELTIIQGLTRSTPVDGSPPHPVTPTVTAPTPAVVGAAGAVVHLTIAFTAPDTEHFPPGPKKEAVTEPPTPNSIGILAKDLTTTGTDAPGTLTMLVTGGPATYDVAISGMTDSGTIAVQVLPAVVVDAWGTQNDASAGEQAVSFTYAVAPSFTSSATATSLVGSSSSIDVTTAAVPASDITLKSGPLPGGLTFTPASQPAPGDAPLDPPASATATATIGGTPNVGTGGLYPLTFHASNAAGGVDQSFTLTNNEPASISSSAPQSPFSVGTVATYTITTHGYPIPTISDPQTTLPDGLTFTPKADGTATIGGTPKKASGGQYTVNIVAHNGIGTDATQQFTLTVNEAPSISSASTATFVTDQPGTFSVTTGHEYPAPPTLTVTGTLPSGVTFVDNHDGTATLSGSPAIDTAGPHDIAFKASNGVNPDASQQFTLTVHRPPAITSVDHKTFITGSSDTFTVATTGYPVPAIDDAGASLPSGLTFTDKGDGTATISGSPNAGSGGQAILTLTADNAVGTDATQQFTLTVDEAPSISSAASTTFTVATTGTFAITTAKAFPTPPTLTAGAGIPAGVTFTDNGNGTGTLAGKSVSGTGGVHTFSITAANGITPNAVQSFTLTVDEAPAITSADHKTFTVGTHDSITITATGYPVPSVGDTGATLPSGLTFTPGVAGTATISGTPNKGTGGQVVLTLTAGNGVGTDASQPFTLTIDKAPSISSASSTTFTVGTAGAFAVTTGKAYPTPPALSAGSGKPSGVTFTDNGNGTGTLAGKPAPGTGGVHTFSITAANGVTPDAVQSFSLTVDEAASMTSPASATFTIGTPGTITITTRGFPKPTLANVTSPPTLPAGLTFTDKHDGTATLSGSAAVGSGGDYPQSLKAHNGVGADGSQVLVVHVVAQAAQATGGFGFHAVEGAIAPSQRVATFTDPSGSDAVGAYTATVSWGDGSPDAAGVVTGPVAGVFTVEGAHTYVEEGNPLVRVTVHHVHASDANTVTDPATVTDAPLTGTAAAALNSSRVLGAALGTIQDGDPAATASDYSVTVSWGDGRTSTATVTGMPGGFMVTASHLYPRSGPYTIRWTATDAGGSSVTRTVAVVVSVDGYWLVAGDGGVFPFGPGAGAHGSAAGVHLNQPIVAIASTPDHGGYWLVASDGGVFPFGDAGGFGSAAVHRLNQPIVGMAATPSGRGYWLVASDGGVFPFGDAGGFGSAAGHRLNQPIVAMAGTLSGRGYWLVASDGGVFPFGDAGGYGSAAVHRLNQPIVGMAATPSGRGYWLVASDGGVFPFGDAGGHGSTGGVRLNRPIVGMARSDDGGGYWLVASDGGVFPFGDAFGYGSAAGVRLNRPIVGMAGA